MVNNGHRKMDSIDMGFVLYHYYIHLHYHFLDFEVEMQEVLVPFQRRDKNSWSVAYVLTYLENV